MFPNRAEFWAFATELGTLWVSFFAFSIPQFVLAVWSGGLGNGESYASAMGLLFAGSLAGILAYIAWGAVRQRRRIKAIVRDGLTIRALARTVPTILETILRYYTSIEPVICESEEEALRFELPVRQWAIRDGALKPGQHILFLTNRDRSVALMLRPEYLAYLDKHSAERLSKLLEGTRNARLSSEVMNSWVDVRRRDQAIAS